MVSGGSILGLIILGIGAFFLLRNGQKAFATNGTAPISNLPLGGQQVPKEILGSNGQVSTVEFFAPEFEKTISLDPIVQQKTIDTSLFQDPQLFTEIAKQDPTKLVETTFTEIPIEAQLAERIDPDRTLKALAEARGETSEEFGGFQLTAQQLSLMKLKEAENILATDPTNTFQLSQQQKALEELARFN